MEKLKINIPNEIVAQKVYDKALALGYTFFKETKGDNGAKIVFLDEDGDITHLRNPPEDFFSGPQLKFALDLIDSYPTVEGEEFLKR